MSTLQTAKNRCVCLFVWMFAWVLLGCSQLPENSNPNAALQRQYESDLAHWQSFAETDPYSYWPAMAQANHRLGALHWQALHLSKAKQAYTEALRLERLLAQSQAKPHQYEAIASTLSVLGKLNESSGQFEAAKRQYQELVAIRRKLVAQAAQANSDTKGGNPSHQSDASQTALLAIALSNLSGVYWVEKNNFDVAQKQYQEALVLLRGLLEKQPQYRMQLAAVLNNLGTLQEQIGQAVQARAHFEEALALQRLVLAQAQAKSRSSAASYWPHIAATLNNLGYLNHKAGNTVQARTQLEEALKIRKTLTQQVSKHYESDWALTLVNLADLNRSEKQHQQARAYYQEALDILRAQSADAKAVALVRSVQEKLSDLALE